jgi:hypothetical protein
MNWLELARVLVEALVKRIEAADDMRAEKRDGRTVMPPFAELSVGAYDDRAFARELLRVACKADPRLRDALVVVATLAKDVDHDTLRELVSVLPIDEA